MSSKSETGHAKNVANFEQLVSFCRTNAASYNPGVSSIQLPAIESKLIVYRSALTDVNFHHTAYNNAVNHRYSLFSTLRPFATRIVNLMDVLGASTKSLEDARGYLRKMRGVRVSKKIKLDPNASGSAIPDHKQISVSRQSFVMLSEHFDELITALEAEPTYTPIEPEFTTATLRNLLADLRTANSKVTDAYMDVTACRINRDNEFYNNLDCLCDIAEDVKKYVKAYFGTKSPLYKQISKLRFVRVRR